MSDLLKVKVGGSDYLCKWEPNFVIIGGRSYNTVKIGSQIWMAENLDWKFEGCVIGASGTSTIQPRGNYYGNDETTYGVNGNKYGLLYNWAAINYIETNKSSLIPGWHVPTYNDWMELMTSIGGSSSAGTKLKSATGWSSGAGTDDYGFNAFPAGVMQWGDFSQVGSSTVLWSSTPGNVSLNQVYSIQLGTGSSASVNKWDDTMIYYCYSLRLVKDAT